MSLRYGQTIRIKSYQRKGYITSKSYTDPNLYFQIYNRENSFIQNNAQIIDIQNYRESLFQILPTSSFEINDQMNSMKSETKKAESAPRAKTQQEQFKAIIAQKRGRQINFDDKVVFKHLDSQYYVYGSFDCAKSGIGAFRLDLRPQLSEKVIFKLVSYRTYEKGGDEISLDAPLMIYHCETQCFLSYVLENIFIDKNYQFDRQANLYKMNSIPHPYIKTFKMLQDADREVYHSSESIVDALPKAARFEIINENIAKRVWRLQQHLQMQMKPNRQQIRNHDIVYFIHTKDDKYLCPDNFTNHIYLKKRKGQSDINQIFDGLWEIQQRKQTDQKQPDITKSNRKKLGSSIKSGFPGNTIMKGQTGGGKSNQADDTFVDKISNEKYIIRHLISGRILYASESFQQVHLESFSRNYRNKPMLFECVDSMLADNALIRFKVKISAKKSKHLCVKKYAKKSKMIKNTQKVEGQSQEFIEDNQQEIDMDQINNTYEGYFEKQQLQLINEASQHGFRIYKIDDQIRQIALFIMSSQQLLYKFTNFVDQFQSIVEFVNDVNVYFLNTIINVMRALIGFVYNCQYHKIAESGNSPIVKRQRAFDQLGMIQLITHLVERINDKSDLLKKIAQTPYNKQSQYMKIRNIYLLGYQILQCVAASNYPQKIHISKYLKTYLSHVQKSDNKTAYKSLQQVLDDNYLALEKKIDNQYIKQLIASFDKENPDPSDLQFLSRLCLCKERTVPRNQNSIFQFFYNADQTGSNKFNFRKDQGKMQISSRISSTQPSQFRTLPQMYQECEISQMEGMVDPQKGHWNYFLQYLNLLADVCVLKNDYPHTYILNKLPLNTLVYFLKEPVVKKKLLFQPFIRLVHHAFIENKKYERMNRITKVKNWDDLDYFQIPKTKEQIGNQLTHILSYIKEYLAKINSHAWEVKPKKKKGLLLEKGKETPDEEPTCIEFDPQEPSKLKMVKTFLEIFKSTLTLGFWLTMEDLKAIVPYMLKILSFDIQYADRQLSLIKQRDAENNQNRHLTQMEYRQRVYAQIKQQLTLNKPSINMLVQCKLIAAEILDIIADYQYNIKVSIITKYFKDIIQMQIDFKYSFDRLAFLKKWYTNKQFNHFVPQNQKEGNLMIQQLWIDKIKQMIRQRDLFSQCITIDKYLVFFETFIYENKQLSNLVLSIMTKISNQRKHILNTFMNIIIVAGGTLSKLADRVLITRSMLLSLNSFSVRQIRITSSNNSLWGIVKPDSRETIEQQSKSLGAIQELAFLTMAMKKDGKPTPLKASKFYEQTDLYPFKGFYQQDTFESKTVKRDRSYLIITQKQQNNPLNQNLIKSQDHHLIIIQFIKIMTQIPQQYPLPIKALHASYNFLTVLVWNNFQNKQYLYNLDILKITQCHLSINVGCIDFYKQMYRNNKTLVLKSDVTPLVHKIIQIVNSQQMYYYHKSKLMDFLRVLVIFDQKGIDRNQNIVMEIISLYQVSDNNQIVYLKTSNDLSDFIQKNFQGWIRQYSINYQYSIQNYANLDVSAQLFYIATFFEIFSALIENENDINIGKCNNMHPHSFLLGKLSKSQHCWPVIRHLRAYMNKLYYFPKREKDTQLFELFISQDLQNIKKQLRGIVQLKCNCPQYFSIKIINPVRYVYLSSYVYLTLQQILHSLDLMFSNSDFEIFMNTVFNQVQTSKNPLHFRLLQILQMLEYLLKTMDGRYINNYLAAVRDHIRKMVGYISIEIIQAFNEQSKAQISRNMANNFAFDDVPFRKRYVFHESKGFWRHLIDWNAFHEQQINRDKTINTIQKKSEKDVTAQSKQSQTQKKKQYLIQLLCLGNIEKKICKKMAVRAKNQKQQNVQEKIIQQQAPAEAALPKNLVTSKSARFRIKNQRFTNLQIKNAVINNRRKKLVKFIQINPQFKAFQREQTQQTLYKMFNELDNVSLNAHGMTVVGKQDVIRSIVKMNKLNSSSITPDYKLVIIRLLINFIKRQSQVFSRKDIGEIDFWQLKQQEKIKIKQAQLFLNKCGCSQFICSLLMNDFTISTKMCNAIVLFAIMMLIGKNTDVQNSMLQLLKNDEKNIIFSQIEKLVKDSTVVVASNAFDPVEQQYVENINYADTYDYYNSQDNCMKRKFKFEPVTIMEQRQFVQKYQFLQTVFIFFKVLCQGNNSQIKNYIRQQTTNDQQKKIKQESVNFIGLAVTQLKKIFDRISLKIIKVPFSIVDFLNQVTQIPCIDNQLFLCSSTFFQDFRNLSIHLQETKVIPFTSENLKILNRFYSLNFKNISSCLEGGLQQIRQLLSSQDLCNYYVNAFTFSIQHLPHADQNWKNFTNAQQLETLMINHQHHKNLIIDLFQITAVISKLKHLNILKGLRAFERKIDYQLGVNHVKQYFELFERNMLGIQVHIDSFDGNGQGQNQLLFFPKHPVFNYLSRQTRATLMAQINRSTQRDKIIGLVKATDDITQQIDYGYQLDHHVKIFNMTLSISSNKIQIYKSVGLKLATFLCFLIPYLAIVIYYPDDQAFQYYLGNKTKFINIIAMVQFAFAFVYFILWLKNKVKLSVKKYQREQRQKGLKSQSGLWYYLYRITLIKNIFCLLNYDKQVSGVILFMTGSTLGTFYRKQCFSILLINIMMENMDVLKNVIAAITTNMRMLGMLSLLGASFIAIFSIFSMNYYAPSLYPQDIPKQHCQNILDCILQLYIKQQIGNDMDKFQSGRFFFDMLYTIFMDTLFGNIVGGVLIDTFAQLRDKRDEIENDKKGFCFMCGIQRETLQKKNQDLKTHYKTQYHKLWNYVFYLYHLKIQEKKTGLENIIEDKVKRQDVTWIPTTVNQQVDIGSKIVELQAEIKKQSELINKIQIAQG